MLRTEHANLQAKLHAELHARLHNVKNVCAKLEVLDKLEELDALTNAAGTCIAGWRSATSGGRHTECASYSLSNA
jgi:hypothetical protein